MGNNLSKKVFEFKTKVLNSRLDKLDRKSEGELGVISISKLNLKKRRALVQHAVDHSPFYREKYAGLGLSKDVPISSVDFLKIPPLTREEIKANFKSIKATNVAYSDCQKVSTSGSTGTPVSLLHDQRYPETPIRWRILKWWGV